MKQLCTKLLASFVELVTKMMHKRFQRCAVLLKFKNIVPENNYVVRTTIFLCK